MIIRIGLALFLIIVIQGFASIGQIAAHYWSEQSAITEIKQRISLDIASLDLGSENIQSVPDEVQIQRYLNNLNLYLETQEYPVRVQALSSVAMAEDVQEPAVFDSVRVINLSANEQEIGIRLNTPSVYASLSVSYVALLFGAVLIGMAALKKGAAQTSAPISTKTYDKKNRRRTQRPVVLTIDLRKKALYLKAGRNRPTENSAAVLSNKPFCFYVAMIKFCQTEQANQLVHQSPLPDKLLDLADETFKQLMELGHTKRKQPDFSSNLDKTLSEIRAALDDVFADFPKEKARFYPPKAQGEGSRTKRHSFGLEQLADASVNIVS